MNALGGKRMIKSSTDGGSTALWTPWGQERILKPGEKFAKLRNLAKRLRAARGKKLPRTKFLD